ncbi:MAG: substrate-binding domain-containing protein [Pseudolabrys sp.]|nr:substrate-binding domain-containing protein [Pseudolabrys sp.]
MSEPLKVITTVALQAVVDKLEPAFTKATGLGIEMAFGPPSAAGELIRKGGAAHIVVSTPDGIDALIQEGLVATGTSRPVVRMQMGLAVGVNEPKPEIATAEQFKAALLGAASIIHANPATGSPSAAHFLKVVQQLGIADEVARKTTVRSGVVAHAVASGECAMAVQQLAELKLVDGVHVLGPFPHDLQNYVPLSAAVHAQSRAPQAAKVLIDLIPAREAKAIIVDAGLLPPA